MRITDLVVGAEIQGWVRTGLALKKGVNKDGSAFRYVPDRLQVIGPDGLQRFVGLIQSNDTVNRVITLTVSRMDYRGLGHGDCLPATIPYDVFQRIRFLSPFAHDPKPAQVKSPFNKQWKPYRTLIEVVL